MIVNPFFILTLLFVYSQGESCGPEPCKDLRSAKACDKVEYCIVNDWSKRVPENVTDDVCQICLSMVKQARDQLRSNETLEQIKEVFEGSCKLLVLKPLVDECDKLADEFAPELVAILSSEMDPQVVCSVAKLCGNTQSELKGETKEQNKSEDGRPQKPRKAISLGDPVDTLINYAEILPKDECKACTGMFSTIYDYARNDANYLKERFTILCNEVSRSEECEKFVEEQFPYLRKAIIGFTDPKQICPELVFPCSSELVEQIAKNSSLEGSCNFCQNAFQSLIAAFRTSTNLGSFTERFIETCDAFPIVKRNACTQFMSSFVNSTVESLRTKFTENDTCNFLNVCPAPGKVSTEKEVKDGPCQLCMMVVETVYQELRNNKSEAEVRKVLEGVCRRLPRTLQGKCQNLVDKYAEEIVNMVIQNLTPMEVCRALSFCVGSQKTSPSNAMGLTKEGGGKVPCRICLTIMEALMRELSDSNGEEEIRKALEGVCKYFPEETRDTCRNLIDQYAEDIIDMIIADFNPSEVCVYLKFCPPHRHEEHLLGTETFDVRTNEIKDDPRETCKFCRLLERSMNDEEKKRKASEAMLALLVETCMIDTEVTNPECSKKLSEEVLPYGTEGLFKLNNICEKYMNCPEEKPDMKRAELLERIHSAVQECAMCEALVGIVTSHEKMLTKRYNFAGNASLICSSVPSNKMKLCMTMIVSYGPSIVNLYVDQKVKPDNICFRLTLCDESIQTKVHMPVTDVEQGGPLRKVLESRDCLQGPGFWCANVENAKKCGTFLHCQEAVWENGEPPK